MTLIITNKLENQNTYHSVEVFLSNSSFSRLKSLQSHQSLKESKKQEERKPANYLEADSILKGCPAIIADNIETEY